MGKIRVHEFTTMDGVIDEPRWTADFGFDPGMGTAIGKAMGGCDAILLGRTTYEMFEPAWSIRTAEEDPGAPFMNDTTKYVVSSTLTDTTWRNSEIVGPYDPATIKKLKDQVTGGLYVSGSGTLVRALLRDNLVDELHLFVYPITRASDSRLFGQETGASKWELAESQTYDNGVVYLNYTVVS
jgi:dihydrofolate reductase